MKTAFRALLMVALACLWLPAGAACPVGKGVGDTWCEKGMQWRCERCGSEYCPIFTGKRCLRDDDVDAAVRPAFRDVLRSAADQAAFVRLKDVAAEPLDRVAHGS